MAKVLFQRRACLPGDKYAATIIFCLVILFSGCNNISKKDGIGDTSKNYSLSYSHKKDLFLSHPQLAMSDSFLVIVSSGLSEFCTVYDAYNELDEVCKYGKIGNGPGEFIQPLLTYACGNTFGLNEINKQELAIMGIKQEKEKVMVYEKGRLKKQYKRQRGNWTPSDYYFVSLDENHYVSLTGTENGNFFTLSDSAMIPIRKFGESPVEYELAAMNSRNRLSGKIVACHGKMAFATIKLPYLALYEERDGEMVKKWSLFYAKTAYGVKNGDLLFDKDKATGPALDIEMDERYIYVLYMNQLLSEYDYFDSKKSCSDQVLVFDYTGSIVARLNLNCRIQEMAVWAKGLKLFGVSQDPDNSLVTFEMPQMLYTDK
jgi:hypothetical protein